MPGSPQRSPGHLALRSRWPPALPPENLAVSLTGSIVPTTTRLLAPRRAQPFPCGSLHCPNRSLPVPFATRDEECDDHRHPDNQGPPTRASSALPGASATECATRSTTSHRDRHHRIRHHRTRTNRRTESCGARLAAGRSDTHSGRRDGAGATGRAERAHAVTDGDGAKTWSSAFRQGRRRTGRDLEVLRLGLRRLRRAFEPGAGGERSAGSMRRPTPRRSSPLTPVHLARGEGEGAAPGNRGLRRSGGEAAGGCRWCCRPPRSCASRLVPRSHRHHPVRPRRMPSVHDPVGRRRPAVVMRPGGNGGLGRLRGRAGHGDAVAAASELTDSVTVLENWVVGRPADRRLAGAGVLHLHARCLDARRRCRWRRPGALVAARCGAGGGTRSPWRPPAPGAQCRGLAPSAGGSCFGWSVSACVVSLSVVCCYSLRRASIGARCAARLAG